MKKNARKIVAIIIFALAVILIVTGFYGYSLRSSEKAQGLLEHMRMNAVMRAAANGIIDEIALQAKKDARKYADEQGYTRNQRTEYADRQEALARSEAEARYLQFEGVDGAAMNTRIAALRDALIVYSDAEAAEKEVYGEHYNALYQRVEELGNELNTVITEEYAAAAEAAEAEGLEKVSYAYDMKAFLSGALGQFGAEYNAMSKNDQKIVDKLLKKKADAVMATLTATAAAESAAGEDDAGAGTETAVDYSFFIPSESLVAMQEAIEPEYASLWGALMAAIPDLTEDMQKDMKDGIFALVYQPGETFETVAKRVSSGKSGIAFSAENQMIFMLTQDGDNMIAIGVGLIFLAACVFFYKELVGSLGMPRLVILMFLVLLCVMASLYGINVQSMIGNILKRTGMYGVLALAMLPGIQCGISLNMGMTVGIIAGLMSTMIALEMNMVGWSAFLFSCGLGVLFAIPVGWLYAKLLNRLKGNEMTVSTYVGFSIVSLFCIAWMLLPFHNPKLTWALGLGLRVMHNMSSSFGSLLNNLWAFRVGGVLVPTGLLLFLFVSCLAMWLFTRSKTGIAMIAVGSNPRFAEASGINVNRMRTLGTVLSTCIAAVGIIVYAQSFGFMQLYNGPKQMGFVAASAILIGGASVSRGKVSHVIIGTFLFQGVLAMGIQVANAAISEGGLSEVMRILISNGIILYALTQSGGGKNGK